MIKRPIALITLCFLLASSLTAYADLLIEPENDSSKLIVVIILLVALVIGTTVLIRIF